ncbi:(d)CMP kinase [Embleya sp. NPDC059237]|uniref:(d)CMP kinase n=1 Tax=Embleya sp. NPDC059237 TaxID=3346784 RepID=UPI0036BEC4C5
MTTLPTHPAPTTPTYPSTGATRHRVVGALTTSSIPHAAPARRRTGVGHSAIVHPPPRVHRSAGDPATDGELLAAIATRTHEPPVSAPPHATVTDRRASLLPATGGLPPEESSLGQVSVDGPNAAGKTTLMLALVHAFHVPGLDTGPTYRTVAAHAIPQSVAPADLARHLTVVVRPGLPQRLLWRGVDTRDEDLFGSAAAANLRGVAGDPQWREAIRALHARVCAQHPDIVVVGRDVAPTLLPAAGLNVFLDAEVGVRRARRELQWADHPERPVHVDILSIRDLDTRAWITRHRPPERRLDLDTTHLGIDQVLDRVCHSLPA